MAACSYLNAIALFLSALSVASKKNQQVALKKFIPLKFNIRQGLLALVYLDNTKIQPRHLKGRGQHNILG